MASSRPQGVAAEEELTDGVEIDTPGAAWTGVAVDSAGSVPVAELSLFTVSGVAASTDVEGGARGVAVGSAEAGLGSDGTVGSLATVRGAACKGAAALAAGRSGLT